MKPMKKLTALALACALGLSACAGPGGASSHSAPKVLNRTALICPFFNFDRFTLVIPTLSDKSLSDIFRSAITRSSLSTIFPIGTSYSVSSD